MINNCNIPIHFPQCEENIAPQIQTCERHVTLNYCGVEIPVNNIVFIDTLPEVGDRDLLYVVQQSIYRWDNDQLVFIPIAGKILINQAKEDFNLKNGEGEYSLVQNGNDKLLSPIVTGTQSVAFGGRRFDYNGDEEDVTSEITANQCFSSGCGNKIINNSHWSGAIGKDNIIGQYLDNDGNLQDADLTYCVAAIGNSNKIANKNKQSGAKYFSGIAVGIANELYGTKSFIQGSNNKITSELSFVSGYMNKSGAARSVIFGGKNNIKLVYTPNNLYNMIFGSENIIEQINKSKYVRNNLLLGTGLKVTDKENQIVLGKYNEEKDGLLFSIGNGASDADRKNVFEVLIDGRAKVQSAPQDADDAVRKKELDEAVALLLDDKGATAAIDSFKELQELLGSDTTGAGGLIEQVNENTEEINNISNELDKKFDKAGGTISGDVAIQGNLNVSGETTTLDTVTLQVKDNVIVANADGAELVENAGFAMKTSATAAYGIMYDPVGDGVKIGLGAFDANGKFEYVQDEAQFLATRADNIVDNHTVVWDNEKKIFVDSGVDHNQLVMKYSGATGTRRALMVDTENNLDWRAVASFTGTSTVTASSVIMTGAQGEVPARATPSNPYEATSKNYVDIEVSNMKNELMKLLPRVVRI